jgi:hypothetical protein
MLIREISPKSDKQIDFIMREYPHLLQYSFSNTYFIKLLYTLFCKAEDTKIKTVIEHTHNEKVNPESCPFLPQEIKIYIASNHYELYTIKYYFKNTCFEVKLYTLYPENIQHFVYFIRFVILLCSKEVELKEHYSMMFVLTPFEKDCNHSLESLEPKHINSGYTYKNEIVIFRKEELLRVFVHECFHLFCLDFNQVDVDFKKLLQPLFHVKSNYLLFESLCEFWSRTVNAGIFAFFIEKHTSYHDFERIFQLNLNIERVHAMLQMKHFLSKFHMSYEDLIRGNIKSYQEKTNGICYYVITTILLFNYQQTMNWFIENNETLLQFSKTTNHVNLFFHFIKSVYSSDKFLNTLSQLNKYDLKHLSFSAFDIELFKRSSQSGEKGNAED